MKDTIYGVLSVKFNKLLSIIVAICSVFTNYSSAQIDIEIRQNGSYFVQCNNNNNLFTTTTGLSNGLNNLTYHYFKTTSVVLDNNKINTLIFKGVETVDPCTLSLTNTANFKPNIIFDCGNNKVNFTKINCENIYSLRINSKKDLEFSNILTTNLNTNETKIDNDKIIINGAFCIGNPYKSFELTCISK